MSDAVNFGENYAASQGISAEAYEHATALNEWLQQTLKLGDGMLHAAQFWAGIGYVMPLTEPSNNDPHAGKRPHSMLGRGYTQEEAGSRDPEQIERWWRASERGLANVSIVTRRSQILVIDVDPRHGGERSMQKLAADAGIDLADVPRSGSPRLDGGYHLWFRIPDGVEVKCSILARGVDRPWQVPVPPSARKIEVDPGSKVPERRYGYRPYTWLAGDPRALPMAPDLFLGAPTESAFTQGEGGIAGVASMPVAGLKEQIGDFVDNGVPLTMVQSDVFFKMACSMCNRDVHYTDALDQVWLAAQRSKLSRQDEPWLFGQIEHHVSNAYARIGAEIAQAKAYADMPLLQRYVRGIR